MVALEQLWQSVPISRMKTCAPTTVPNSIALAGQVRAMLATEPDLGEDPLVRRAWQAAVTWLDNSTPDSQACPDGEVVLGQGDCNLANFLWDGAQIRIVDFEDSGPSDRAFELAILVEHISAWSDASLEADTFLAQFELTTSERARLRQWRRLAALFWMILLRPDGPASCRNPPGTLKLQASRLLTLLG